MQIRKATTQDLECVRELTRETICQIYPKYYVACHAKRKKLTRKTKKTLLNTTFKSVFCYL